LAGRVCHAIELDPIYVDVAVRRWQAFTGKAATLEESGESFSSVADRRGVAPVTENHGAARKKA
jgi:DNA modification methylase